MHNAHREDESNRASQRILCAQSRVRVLLIQKDSQSSMQTGFQVRLQLEEPCAIVCVCVRDSVCMDDERVVLTVSGV